MTMPSDNDDTSASFKPKCCHWIHASSPFCRNPNGDKGDDAQQERRHQESDWIQGLHSKEKASQKAREPKGSASTNRHAYERKRHSLSDNHVAKMGSLRPKRHANAEFLCALLHGVGHHSINSDPRHQQTGESKHREQQHVESLTRSVARFDFIHGTNVRDGQTTAGVPQGGCDGGHQRAWVDPAADDPPEWRYP